MRNYLLIPSAALMLLCGLPVKAQVTIGMGQEPVAGALLQLKENEITDDGPNATKGLEFPRVQLVDENNLYPMFYDSLASSPTPAYQRNKTALDKTHCGLVVYNTNGTSPFQKGLHIWTGFRWIPASASPWRESVTGQLSGSQTGSIYRSGNVTIGTDDIVTDDAILNVSSSDKGVLLPRVTLTAPDDSTTIANPSEGLLVYNTGKDENFTTAGYMYWDGKEWKLISNVTSVAPRISQLYCNRAELSPSSYKTGEPYIGVLKVPYAGGNGGWYNAPGTIVIQNGLVFYLQGGKLENGVGELVFAVMGMPSKTSGPGGETSITLDKTLIPFYTGNCTVTVGRENNAEVSSIATMGPLQFTLENGVAGYGRTLTTPDRKFSVRIFVPEGTNMSDADLQIRNNQNKRVDIMWSAAYAWKGDSSGASANRLELDNGLWAGNGGGDSSENTVYVTSDKNVAWGNRDVYFSNSPEQRSYMWTTKDSYDQTFYHMTFMMGASDTGAADDARAASAKAFLKIDQIHAMD
ncbi:MAG: hypothetical protein LBS20_17830 [Prevotella sp.]|jgi:hypothetical protein|nr:hypothetical protein [Prevotella sp.]